jgi:hypothetical protein
MTHQDAIKVHLPGQELRDEGNSPDCCTIMFSSDGEACFQQSGQASLSDPFQCLTGISLLKQVTGSDADRDLLYSLHDFQLKTNVTVTLSAIPDSGHMRVLFTSFQAKVLDRYDWDYSKHLKVPNPDFGSTKRGAVLPSSSTVEVYHSNAKRLEDAKLAAPFDVESKPWTVNDMSVVGPAEIDPKKSM